MSQTNEHDRLSITEWRQRQDENRDARRDEMDARRESAREEHKAAVDAQTAETPEVEFMDAGYDETLPGQIEVVAGSVVHEQVLKSYPNATSYGPDHNVVVPEPEPPPEEGGVTRTEEEEEEQRRIAEQERMNDGR